MKRKIAAIVAADVAGYSRLVAEDEEATLRRFAEYREVFDGFIERHGGRIFNTAGDSVMSEFDSAVEAVRAAIDIQESLRSRNIELPPGRRVEFRIGITIGDVVEREGDLLGDGVNIAARLQGVAPPGGVVVSRTVHEAVANKVGVGFRDLGRQDLKNIPTPVEAYAVAWPGERIGRNGRGSEPSVSAPSPMDRRPGGRQSRSLRLLWYRWRWLAVLMLVVFVVLPTLRSVRRVIDGIGVPATGETVTPQGASSATDPKAKGGKAADPGENNGTPADKVKGDTKSDRGPDGSAAFAALLRDGKPVQRPRTAAELYANARLYEARGADADARRTYLALARLETDFIDPALRFAGLLRLQDGRAGAREALTQVLQSDPARALTLVQALQFEGIERRRKVEAFAAANGDYPPAQYALAQVYADAGDAQTLTERRLEYDAWQRLIDADARKKLAPFFLDQSMRTEWIAEAKKRSAAIETQFKSVTTRPSLRFLRADHGWVGVLTLPEPARSVTYRVGEAGDFQPSTLGSASGGTGTEAAMDLGGDLDRTAIYVRYADVNGREAGPFAFSFDPRTALAANQRKLLEVTPSAWVDWAADRDQLYFGHLITYRCAIRQADIGFGDAAPATPLPLPPCDPKNPYAKPPDATSSVPVPDDARSVGVQLTWDDGTRSGIQVFRRP